jgi:His/Glu/Gln/Arg/opine family amino acid ABC transporter permease subunit
MNEQTRHYEPGKHPDQAPPVTTVGVLGWLRQNLFSSWSNVVLTILALYIIYKLVPGFIDWAFIKADWVGHTRQDCHREGACWVFIHVWFKQLMYGRYPDAQLWRIDTSYVLLVTGITLLLIPRFRYKQWVALFLLVVYPLVSLYLFTGLTRATIEAWPYRLMELSAMALGIVALLPLLGILRERSTIVSIVLLVLVPLWGLSAPATWTAGLLYGAPVWASVVGVALATLPPIALVAALMLSPWRKRIAENFWQLCIGVVVLAYLGYLLPLWAWQDIAGSSPPAAMALTAAMLALAALCPWGYYDEAGLPGYLARLLLPVYLIVAWLVFAGPPDLLNFGSLDWTANTESWFAGIKQTALPEVETPLWGGLFLTLVIAITGIVASLPIGIVLALGRRSHMPIVRAVCVGFIEFWRGVPLITVLFMSSVMFPLFMPEGVNFDKLVRALVGVAIFSAAYMAEVVRGGLQAIPKGQFEGAQALGLSYPKMMVLIILPQALKLVIPGIVNTFIGLFKDTTLVLIIGLFDFLGMAQLAATNPDWLGFAVEGYVFVGFGFWIFCFSMSRYSQHLEKKLHTGH